MDNKQLDFAHILASAIHDMKNSLIVLVGSMEGIADELKPENPGMSSRLGKMIYETKRLNSNLIELLGIYKIGNGIYPLDIQDHPVRDAIEEVLLYNAPLLELKNVSVELDCDPDCSWFFDRELFMGIVNNALNNAINYTRDKVRISAVQEEGELHVRIEDNGKGYPPFMLEKDFCAHAGTGALTGSTGLGLFFSSQVAHLHSNRGRNGSVRLENGGKYGGGCFVFSLP